ncbi:hypothetical protein DQ04_02431010 [Trypanosoma grayi]|uniref:hypothetical protein n=1 Tax=Trypanosoma grayi TaxID=71804 RepID=UPI0004F47A71|nr:hypothetical protein DQ04_02431010 [Trypanosoma grayi]KEG11621.1 hypothetical protein DQ04_02431010 [Trypanosoma grayi]
MSAYGSINGSFLESLLNLQIEDESTSYANRDSVQGWKLAATSGGWLDEKSAPYQQPRAWDVGRKATRPTRVSIAPDVPNGGPVATRGSSEEKMRGSRSPTPTYVRRSPRSGLGGVNGPLSMSTGSYFGEYGNLDEFACTNTTAEFPAKTLDRYSVEFKEGWLNNSAMFGSLLQDDDRAPSPTVVAQEVDNGAWATQLVRSDRNGTKTRNQNVPGRRNDSRTSNETGPPVNSSVVPVGRSTLAVKFVGLVETRPTPPMNISDTPVASSESPLRRRRSPARSSKTPVALLDPPGNISDTPVASSESPLRRQRSPTRPSKTKKTPVAPLDPPVNISEMPTKRVHPPKGSLGPSGTRSNVTDKPSTTTLGTPEAPVKPLGASLGSSRRSAPGLEQPAKQNSVPLERVRFSFVSELESPGSDAIMLNAFPPTERLDHSAKQEAHGGEHSHQVSFQKRRMRRYAIREEGKENDDFRIKTVAVVHSRDARDDSGAELPSFTLTDESGGGMVSVVRHEELRDGCLVELKTDYDLDEVLRSTNVRSSLALASLLNRAHCGQRGFLLITYATGCRSRAVKLSRKFLKGLVKRFKSGAVDDGTKCDMWLSVAAVIDPHTAVDLLRSTNEVQVVALRNGFVGCCGPCLMGMNWADVATVDCVGEVSNIIKRWQHYHPDSMVVGTLLVKEYAPPPPGEMEVPELILTVFTFALTADPKGFQNLRKSKASPLRFFFTDALGGAGVTTHVTCIMEGDRKSDIFFENALKLRQIVNRPPILYDAREHYNIAQEFLQDAVTKFGESRVREETIVVVKGVLRDAKWLLSHPDAVPLKRLQCVLTLPLLTRSPLEELSALAAGGNSVKKLRPASRDGNGGMVQEKAGTKDAHGTFLPILVPSQRVPVPIPSQKKSILAEPRFLPGVS